MVLTKVACIPLSLIGQKINVEKEYNELHGFWPSKVEHLFACLWHWKVIFKGIDGYC